MKRMNATRQWTQAFCEWITNLARQLFLITNKAFARFHDTSASFRCYNKEYYVSLLLFAWNSVTLPWTKWFTRSKDGLKAQKEYSPGTSYNSWCSEQRRAESPKRNTAQGNALGYIEASYLRSERAKGRNARAFLWLLLRLQRAIS